MDPLLNDPRLRIDQYLRDVDTIVGQGGGVSESFTDLRSGWTAATTDRTTAELETAIITAIGTGNAGKVEAAMLAGLVAKLDRSKVRERIARSILPALKSAYSATAGDNYSVIAATFDEAAARFTKCVASVDVTTDANNVVGLSAKAREAWMDAETAATELDALLLALANAASFAGIATTDRSGGLLTGSLIALCSDPAGAHRRRVYEAWASKGRCGRWAGLLALGVVLRAADLAAFEPYREPRPLEVRQVRAGMGVRQVVIDPEDADYTPLSPGTDTPAEIARAKAEVDAWSKSGKSKATR